MHVGDTPAVVAEAKALRPQPGAQNGSPYQDGPPKGGVSGVAKTMHPHTAPLSSATLGATIAAQAEGDGEIEGAGGATAAPGRSGETPAARARALLESDPSLAARPFGQIVSALARGLEVAPADADADDGENSPEPVAGDDGGSDQATAVTTDGDETPVGDPEPDGGAGESPGLAESPDLVAPPPELAVEEALAEVLEEMLEDEEDAGA